MVEWANGIRIGLKGLAVHKFRAALSMLGIIFGVASVHSYDSLSSHRYQALLRGLGGETEQYGRWNSMVAPDFGSLIFWMSNIGLVISPAPILHPNLERFGVEGTLQLYRVRDSMGCCLQSPTTTNAGPGGISSTTREGIRPVKTSDQGDVLEFEVHNYPDTESVLTLSQQYHDDWRASVRTASGWQVARTVPVNGAFQGVVIPAKSELVRLQFMPLVRFAWIAHVFWVIVMLMAVLGRYRHRPIPDESFPAARPMVPRHALRQDPRSQFRGIGTPRTDSQNR